MKGLSSVIDEILAKNHYNYLLLLYREVIGIFWNFSGKYLIRVSRALF